MKYDCIIIGAGASGLMLAAALDMQGRAGLILEKTARPGAKLLASGGGRCNITHGGSARDLVSAYGAAGPRLRKCLYRHSNIALAGWLEDNGIPLADEHGDPVSSSDLEDIARVFPASMKASDVLDMLLVRARANGWVLRTEAAVHDLEQADSGWLVKASPADTFATRFAVIASGGVTYPETGSDGSMLDIAGGLGAEVVPPRSALAPVHVEDYMYSELSGISIPGVTVTVLAPPDMKKTARMTGDLLFTHTGFSGPVILNISRYAEPGSLICIDYGRDLSELPRRLQRVLEKRAAGPSGDVRTSVLAALLERDIWAVSSVDEHGMVTAGGISLDEIDTGSMRLSRFSDDGSALYAIGEAIDADGITGGYNLQMCWSTAMTAADDIRISL